jgi:hypothetical protein
MAMDVSELEKLCAERTEITSEWFTPNDFYGHATLIKRYCGLPQDFVLPGVMPHAPSLQHSVWDAEVNHPLQRHLVFSSVQEKIYPAFSKKPITVIGSPFYCGLNLLADEVAGIRQRARGTIVFPFHSTHHVTIEYDSDSFLNQLKQLPGEWKPITICMYWRDVQMGRHRPYIDAGFDCVSAGHIYDHDFLLRFIREVAARERCFTNEMGTCAYLCSALGLPVTIYRQEYKTLGQDAKLLKESSGRPNLPTGLRFIEISAKPGAEQVAEQRKLADQALGKTFLREPAAFKSLLLELSREMPARKKEKKTWGERVAREVARLKRRVGIS